MTSRMSHHRGPDPPRPPFTRFGTYAAILTAVITIVTFAFALVAAPVSGANCPEDCVEYPSVDTVSQYPRDFLWMPLAIVPVLSYVALMASIHAYAPTERGLVSQVGLCFAVIAAAVLVSDYYVQFAVVPVSLMKGETEGLPLLIQYNPHGDFLALEELGYVMMSVSFLFMAPVFSKKTRLESALRWVSTTPAILVLVSLIVISILLGLDRQDRFEVIILSVDWLALIVVSILLSRLFARQNPRLSTAPSDAARGPWTRRHDLPV